MSTAEPDAFPNGPFLVVRKGCTLPDRCVKCDRPAGGRTIRRRYLWADTTDRPAGGLLRFVPFLRIGFAFASMGRWIADLRTMQSATVRVGICRTHRLLARFYAFLAAAALPVGALLAFESHEPFWALWSIVLGIFVAAIAWRASRVVRPVHVGITHVTLQGIGPRYLSSFAAAAPQLSAPTMPAEQDLLASVAELKRRMKSRETEG